MAFSCHREHVYVKHAQSGKFNVQIDSSSKKRCENATSGRESFLKTEKKVAFSNEYGYLWTGPYSVVIIDQQNSKGRILMSWGGGGVTVGKFLEADAMWLAF